MKVAALMVFKDEEELLPMWLDWHDKYSGVDHYLFLDNGSSDSSVDIVKSHPKTVFVGHDDKPFQTNMRQQLINAVNQQKLLSELDWLYMCAPDIIPFFNVKDACIEARSKQHNSIYTTFDTFFYTLEDYEEGLDVTDPINDLLYWRCVSPYNCVLQTNQIKYNNVVEEPVSFYGGVRGSRYNSEYIFGHYRFRGIPSMQKKLDKINKAIESGTKTFRQYCGVKNAEGWLITRKVLNKRKECDDFSEWCVDGKFKRVGTRDLLKLSREAIGE